MVSRSDQDADSLANDVALAVRYGLLLLLDSLEYSRPKGLWLSYNRGRLTVIGSFLPTLIFLSIDPDDLEERRSLLIENRNDLKKLTELHEQDGHFEFVRLPLRRLGLIMEQAFGEEELRSSFGLTPSSIERILNGYGIGERGDLSCFAF